MITTAVVCPHPPLLFRELSGAQDAVPALRTACQEALAAGLAKRPGLVLVVAGGDSTREWDPGLPAAVRPFGTTDASGPLAAADGLPLGLGVARRLLDEAGWDGPTRMHTVAWDAREPALRDLAETLRGTDDDDALLLVLADGSTRRGEKAPGYLDERSFAFDDEVVRCLEHGDAAGLTALDPELADALMVLGRAALGVLGHVAAQTRPRARLLHRSDPYGVHYAVALWELG